MRRLPLILASASPRRAKLLTAAGIRFKVISSDAEEVDGGHLTGSETAQLNAVRKARTVAKQNRKSVGLSADTVVCLGSRLFGKPENLKEARSMLRTLSGRTHEVVTGCCLVHTETERCEVFHERTHVTFRRLSHRQIDEYLDSIEPLDKAGAYAIQDNGEVIVESVHGSLTNVVGLPLASVCERLTGFTAVSG